MLKNGLTVRASGTTQVCGKVLGVNKRDQKSSLAEQDENRVRDICDRFTMAWTTGSSPPDLSAFVPPATDTIRSTTLETLVFIDLENRLKRS